MHSGFRIRLLSQCFQNFLAHREGRQTTWVQLQIESYQLELLIFPTSRKAHCNMKNTDKATFLRVLWEPIKTGISRKWTSSHRNTWHCWQHWQYSKVELKWTIILTQREESRANLTMDHLPIFPSISSLNDAWCSTEFLDIAVMAFVRCMHPNSSHSIISWEEEVAVTPSPHHQPIILQNWIWRKEPRKKK